MCPRPTESALICYLFNSRFPRCPVAPMVMKCLERLVRDHVTPSLPVTIDSLQFAYQTNRSTDDAMSHLLHTLSGSPRATGRGDQEWHTSADYRYFQHLSVVEHMEKEEQQIQCKTSTSWPTSLDDLLHSRTKVQIKRMRVSPHVSPHGLWYKSANLIRHINQKSKLNGLSMSVISLCVTAGLIPHSEIISHPGVKGAFSWILGDFPASSLISSSHLCHNLAQPIRLKASCFFK